MAVAVGGERVEKMASAQSTAPMLPNLSALSKTPRTGVDFEALEVERPHSRACSRGGAGTRERVGGDAATSLSRLQLSDVTTGRYPTTMRTGAHKSLPRRNQVVIAPGKEDSVLDLALEAGEDITLFNADEDDIRFSVYNIDNATFTRYVGVPPVDLITSAHRVSKMAHEMPAFTTTVRMSDEHVKNVLSVFYNVDPWESWPDRLPIRIHETSHDIKLSRYEQAKKPLERSYRWANQAIKTLVVLANRGISPEIYCAFSYVPENEAARFTCISDGRYTKLSSTLYHLQGIEYEALAKGVGLLMAIASRSLYVTDASIDTVVCRARDANEPAHLNKWDVRFGEMDPSAFASSKIFNTTSSDSSHCAYFVNLLCFFSSLANTSMNDAFKGAFKDLAERMVVMWEEIRHSRSRVLTSMCQSFLGESKFKRTVRQNLSDVEGDDADEFYRRVRNAVYRSLVVRDQTLAKFRDASTSTASIIDKAVVVVASMFNLKQPEIDERRRLRARADVPQGNDGYYTRYEGSGFE